MPQFSQKTVAGIALAVMIGATTPDQTEAAGTLYWASGYKLKRASTDGNCRQTILPAVNTQTISSVVFDPETRKIYFCRAGVIRRCDLDGTNIEVVLGSVSNFDLDRLHRKLYWNVSDQDGDPNQIMRANLDGSSIEQVLGGLTTGSSAIAVDSEGGKVYWTQYSFQNTSGTIHRVNFDGTSHEQVALTGVVPFGIAVHHASGKVFWTDGDGFSTAGGVYRANLDFSNIEHIVLVSALPGIPLTGLRQMATDEAAGKLYVGTDVSTAFRCDLNGGGVVALPLGGSWGIAVVPEKFGFACPGDSNHDLRVNIDDLVNVITSWGPCQSCSADLTGDGNVNIDDLVFVLIHWTI